MGRRGHFVGLPAYRWRSCEGKRAGGTPRGLTPFPHLLRPSWRSDDFRSTEAATGRPAPAPSLYRPTSMRDVVALLFVIGCIVAAFRRPWVGVLALAAFSYMNPHSYAWGFMRSMPVYLILFCVRGGGLFHHQRPTANPEGLARSHLLPPLSLFLFGSFCLGVGVPYTSIREGDLEVRRCVQRLSTIGSPEQATSRPPSDNKHGRGFARTGRWTRCWR